MEKSLEELRRKPTAEEINAMPLLRYDGDVRVIRHPRNFRAALPDLLNSQIIGFDTETRPTFKKGKTNLPALIQMATENAVYIIQLGCLPFREECAAILANPEIIKVGVGIADDMHGLNKIFPFTPGGVVD